MNWISIRFLLVLAEVVRLESNAIEFALAFPQADLDVPLYMELPLGIEIPGAAYKKATCSSFEEDFLWFEARGCKLV